MSKGRREKSRFIICVRTYGHLCHSCRKNVCLLLVFRILLCLLFLGTCFVSIFVAVYVLALRLFRFLLLLVFRLFLQFVPCLSVRSFKISVLIKSRFAAVLKVWHRVNSCISQHSLRGPGWTFCCVTGWRTFSKAACTNLRAKISTYILCAPIFLYFRYLVPVAVTHFTATCW